MMPNPLCAEGISVGMRVCWWGDGLSSRGPSPLPEPGGRGSDAD